MLHEKALILKVDAYTVHDNIENGEVRIECKVHDGKTGEGQVIQGKGVGVVDAFFHALIDLYSTEFPSLNTIRFSDFTIRGDLHTGRATAKSDSEAMASLKVANSGNLEFEFVQSSPSSTRASILVVLAATEFFINCEQAFIQVYKALRYAREENRQDSVSQYTRQLTTLVEATSYSEVIEQIKKEESLGHDPFTKE